MKTKLILLLTAGIVSLTSCDKTEPVSYPSAEAYIDATSKTTWTYFSFSEGKTVGTGEENEADNASWAARTDWDMAVCRYNIRTNSGKASSVGARGGVYVSDKTFDSLAAVPEGASFEVDDVVTSTGMGGTTSVVESTATVITFMANEDGSLVMPPVYLKAPMYIFRTADGARCFKVEFTQYQDENKVSGHVKFHFAQLSLHL